MAYSWEQKPQRIPYVLTADEYVIIWEEETGRYAVRTGSREAL
jgi:hypothetical protein